MSANICLNPLDGFCIGDAASSIGGNLAGNALDVFFSWLTEAAGKAVGQGLRFIATSWLMLPDPNVEAANGPVQKLQESTLYLTAMIAVAALLISATRIVLQRDGREATELLRGLVMLMLYSVGGVPIIAMLLRVGDTYTDWILNQSSDGDVNKRLADIGEYFIRGALTNDATSMLLFITVAFMVIAGSILQLVVALGRTVGIVLLAGLLPLAAGIGVTSGGQLVRQRYTSWTISFVLYKPVAGTIYAGVFWMFGDPNGDIVVVIAGAAGILMAIVALPALMKLISPAVVVAGGSWSNEGGLARANTAKGVAEGAVKLVPKRRSSGGSTPPPRQLPTPRPVPHEKPDGGGFKAPFGDKAPINKSPFDKDPKSNKPPEKPVNNGQPNLINPNNPTLKEWRNGQASDGAVDKPNKFSGPPSKEMLAYAQRRGTASGAAKSGGAAAAGPWVAAAYLAVTAPHQVAKKIANTAASGIQEA